MIAPVNKEGGDSTAGSTGQKPIDPGKPPGWNPVYLYFLMTAFNQQVLSNVEQTEEMIARTKRACQRFADAVFTDFHKFGISIADMPKPTLPANWVKPTQG